MAIEARMRQLGIRLPSARSLSCGYLQAPRNCLHERLGLFNGEYSDTSSALPGQIDEIRGIRQNQVPLDRLIQRRPQDRVGVADGASRKASVHQFAVERLAFNKLPSHWRSLIAGGWQNAHLVSAYLDRHDNPLVGETIAQVFRARYKYLKSQGLSAGAIMTGLFDMVAGVGSVAPSRAVAAQALLAYLFENCDIFENQPEAVSP